jgi:putative heme iron utilization protein
MSSTEIPAPRQHASTGQEPPQLPEPSHAERVRTLLSLASIGTLSTLSRKRPGFPFGSLMPFALDSAGRPVFLISNMAMHTQNLKADPRCSLFIGQGGSDGDPLGAARATLIGVAEPVPEHEINLVREVYLARHENSHYWVDFSDFSFFCLRPIDLYYVGGFGVMGWVEARDYEHAAPDPLAQSAPGILAHMNADHVHSMILLARAHTRLEATEATMTSVDRMGFSLRLKTPEGMKGTRINFPCEVSSPQETRAALVAMVRQANQSVRFGAD